MNNKQLNDSSELTSPPIKEEVNRYSPRPSDLPPSSSLQNNNFEDFQAQLHENLTHLSNQLAQMQTELQTTLTQHLKLVTSQQTPSNGK